MQDSTEVLYGSAVFPNNENPASLSNALISQPSLISSSPSGLGTNLVFIDSNVENFQPLVDGESIDADVFLLNSVSDGFKQISEVISRYENISSIHIVSHGSENNLQLGTSQLSSETLDLYRDELTGWSGFLASEADILIYGCNLAAGEDGAALIQSLGEITGADIAASVDLTGNNEFGGDWELEFETGVIEAEVVFEPGALASFEGVLSTLIVANRTTNSISRYETNGQGGFGAAVNFNVAGTQPSTVVLGDINRDGLDDVLSTDEGSNSISLLINNGVGGFGAAQRFASGGTQPAELALGDVNNDGWLDAISLNVGSNNASVFLNNTSGTFGSAQIFSVGSTPVGLGVADLNGDGNLDVFTANLQNETVSVNLGNGNGSFGTASAGVGIGARPLDMAMADLNADGIQDFITANASSRNVSVGLGNGVGGFTVTSFGVGARPNAVTVGDIDNDGDLDLSTSNFSNNTVAVLRNNGTGGFSGLTSFAVESNPSDVAFGDINGDGNLDIMTSNATSNNISILTGNGSGGFTAQASLTPATTPAGFAFSENLGGGAVPDTTAPVLQTATVNGTSLILTYNEALDGASDPLVSNYVVRVNGVAATVSTANANGTTVALTLGSAVAVGDTVTVAYTPGSTPVQDVAGNDAIALSAQAVTNNTVNGGGNSSLIVTNRNSGTISVFESDGSGGFTTQTTYSTGGTQPFAVAIGDINQDGNDDVVVANRGSDTLALLINNGSGGFLAPQTFAVGDQPVHVILEDVNDDGYLDALAPNNSNGTVSVLLGNTSGGFAPQTTVTAGAGAWEVAMADLNNDGNLDLLTVNATAGTVTVNLGNGLGGFAAPSGNYGVGSRPEGLVLEDVNNDGNIDFIVSNASSRNVSVGLGNGVGGFTTPVNYGTGGSGSSPLAVGDLNRDGFADIAVGNTQDDNLAILLNNGNGTFAAPRLFSLGDQPFDILLRDINGDSNLDVMSANAAANTVTVLAGNGAGNFTLLTTLTTGVAPADLAFGNLGGGGTTNPGGGMTNPTAPTLVNAVVSGTSVNSFLKLIYSERLDGNADPVPGNYTVIVNGVVRTVSNVDVQPGTDAEGTNVILTLANPIVQGDVVSVNYTPGAIAVQDLEGNDAAGFTNQAVTNLRDFTLTYDFMTVGDVFDFTEFGYTYDDGYVTNFSSLPAAAANTTGLDVRKNAAEMTLEEIDAYLNAILTLKGTTVLTNNGIEISLYDQFVAAHVSTSDAVGRRAPDGSTMVNPAHGGSAFMPWHRLLLTEYENALQAVNPDVVLPYWDWTDLGTTMNVVFQDNFMGPAAQGNVTTGYFSLANGWGVRSDLSNGRWTGVSATPRSLGRNVGRNVTNPGTWETNLATILNNNAYNLFANNVERGTGAHNNAHGFVGGTMANVAASPNDPIFWMLHANVDRLWAEWQVNNHWGTGFYNQNSQSYGHRLSDPLYLWDNGAVPIAADLRDLVPKFPGANASAIVNGNTTINGNLQNDGVVAPGNSPGIIHVEGNYNQGSTGELTIELAGREP
ncbi:MAG: FG-GAP-like repeat-containing protein, partial [Thermosynechococcaceae cyanobacterium]